MERAKQLSSLIKTLDLFWGGLERGSCCSCCKDTVAEGGNTTAELFGAPGNSENGRVHSMNSQIFTEWVGLTQGFCSDGQWLRAGDYGLSRASSMCMYTCVFEYPRAHVCRRAGPSETRLLGMKNWPSWSGCLRKVGALTFPPEAGGLHLALSHCCLEEVNLCLNIY